MLQIVVQIVALKIPNHYAENKTGQPIRVIRNNFFYN